MARATPRLLTRPGCGLCDEFAAAWREAFPGVHLPQVDIDRHEALRQRYGNEIPVLLDARDQPLCRVRFDVSAAVAAARQLGGAG